jgi:hypothetical protein
MQTSFLNVRKLMGLLLCLLGATVLTGWMIGSSALVRMMPGSVAMGINTAIMFLVAGIHLLMPLSDAGNSLIQRSCAWILVALSSLILLEHLFDADFGIDLARVHAVIDDGQSRPGRTAPNTCLAFLLAGLAFVLHGRRDTGKRARYIMAGLAIAVVALGFTALLGYIFNLETMYRFATYNRMAAPTAFGLSVLGIGLWRLHIASVVMDDSAQAHEKRITRKTVGVLSVVALSVGLLGFSLIRDSFEQSAAENARLMARTNAISIANILSSGLQLADVLAHRPSVLASFTRMENKPTAEARQLMHETARSLLNAGLSSVEFFGADGALLSSVGTRALERALVTHRLDTQGGAASLLWQDGYVLHIEHELVVDGRVLGMATTEQRLPVLDKLLSDIRTNGASIDVLICGRDQGAAICAPTRFYADPLRVPMYKPDGAFTLPVNKALVGLSGVDSGTDPRGTSVLAACASISISGQPC